MSVLTVGIITATDGQGKVKLFIGISSELGFESGDAEVTNLDTLSYSFVLVSQKKLEKVRGMAEDSPSTKNGVWGCRVQASKKDGRS